MHETETRDEPVLRVEKTSPCNPRKAKDAHERKYIAILNQETAYKENYLFIWHGSSLFHIP